MAFFAVGCTTPNETIASNPLPRTAASTPKANPIDLKNDHLIGVATVAINDAEKVGSVLDKNQIPYGRFNDVSSCGFVVAEPNSERARKLIREDSWNHGYELLKRMNPTPEQAQITLFSPENSPYSAISIQGKDKDKVFDLFRKNVWNDTVITGYDGLGYTVIFGPRSGAKALLDIREDAIKRGYDYRVVYKEELQSKPKIDTRLTRVDPERALDAPVNGSANPDPNSVNWVGKLVTVAAVAPKDVNLVMQCLQTIGIKVHGTWESGGVTGIVIADCKDQTKALAAIQEDARTKSYRLFSTTAREAAAPVVNEWSNHPMSKEDMAAVANLIVNVRVSDEIFVSDCLERHGISSALASTDGLCSVYVSKLDSDRALGLIQEDSRVRGYTYSTERIHYR